MPDQIAGELRAIAQQGISGALVINGSPGAIAYLSDGYLAFAESPAVPDLGSRLINSGRLPAPQWDEVLAESRARGSLGEVLVARGFLTADELRGILASIALDALAAVAAPLTGASAEVSTSFIPQRSHWARSVLRMDAGLAWDHVREEAARARLAGYLISPGDNPRLRDLSRPWAVISRWEWLVACQLDGKATVGDLASRNGLALREVTELIGRLARAGMCVTTPRPALAPARPAQQPEEERRPAATTAAPSPAPGEGAAPGPPPPGTPGTQVVADQARNAEVPGAQTPGSAIPPLPRRKPADPPRPGKAYAAGTPALRQERPVPGETREVDLPLLRQILKGLRSLG